MIHLERCYSSISIQSWLPHRSKSYWSWWS